MSFLIRIIQMFRSETDSYFSLQLPRFTPGTRFKGLLPENAHWRWGSDAFKEEKRKKNVVPITALKRRKPIKCTSRIPIPFSVIRNAYWHSNCRIGNKRKGVDGLILGNDEIVLNVLPASPDHWIFTSLLVLSSPPTWDSNSSPGLA